MTCNANNQLKTRYTLYKAYRDTNKDHHSISEVMKLNKAEKVEFKKAYDEDQEIEK